MLRKRLSRTCLLFVLGLMLSMMFSVADTTLADFSLSPGDSFWKAYSNENYGFSIAYPMDWRVETDLKNVGEKSGVIALRVLFMGESGGINVDIFPNIQNLDLYSWYRKYQAQFVPSYGITQKELVIAGSPAIYSLHPGDREALPRHTTLVSNERYVYRIEYQDMGDAYNLQTYRDMLRSFALKNKRSRNSELFDIVEVNYSAVNPLVDSCCGYNDHGNPYPCDGGNCTWWARYKRSDTGGQSYPYWNNADQWTSRAYEEGFLVNNTPAADAIAGTPRSGYVRPGWSNHVAYVESFDGSTIAFSDMDWQGGCGVGNWYQNSWNGIEFIHSRNSTFTNPSFESGNVDPWTWFDPGACNRAIYSNSTISHDGNYYLATNRNNNYDTCKSFYQDIAQTPAAGDNLRFGIWIRPRSGDLTVEGKVAIWAVGGDPESENTPFSVTGSQWQCVEASLPIQNDGHNGVRTEIYLESNHSADYFFDDASFVRNGGAICPDSPTPTPMPSPTPDPDQGDYVYEAQPEDYVCGTTPPTDGIVEFRLRTYSSESRMRVYVRKCDQGDFSMDGYAYLEVDDQTRWGPISYQAGDSIVSWDIDPCGQFGICDDNWHEYQVYVASKGYPDEPKLAGRVDARKVEVGDPDLQIAELKVRRNDTGEYLSPGDSVPDGTSITLIEYTINCGDADVTDTFYVYYYDNGQFFDDDTELSNVDADCDDTELESTTFNVEGVGNHTLKASVDATDVVPESNEDNNSATFTINVTSAAVAVPTLSTISNSDGDGDYTVDWTPVANATSYELQEDDNNSFNSPSVKYNGAGTVWSASNRPADTYYYRVRACNASDCSDWSGVRSTTVQDETLTAPTLSTINNSDGDGDYTVGWTTVANATSYELQEDDNNSFNSPSVKHNGAGTVWSASNRPADTYYYRVRACNASDCSDWSGVRSTTVQDETLTAPTLSTINNSDGDGDYTVGWTTVANATSYELQEDDNNSFNSPSVVYNAGTVWNASNKPSGSYYYRVRACNTSECSDWSNVQSAIVQDHSLTAPTLSTISNSDGDGVYIVEWTTVANAVSYELQEDDNNIFNSPSVKYNGAGTVWSASNRPADTYYYRVRACNSTRCSAWSNSESVTVNIDPEGTQVFVDPAASTGYVGSSLKLDIVISDVVNLGSFEFVFAYDPALVSVEGVTLGSFPESTGRDFSVMGPNDDGAGSVTFGAYSGGSVLSGAEGGGALAQLRLNLLATGQTSLGLDAVQVTTVPGDSVVVSVRGADLEIGNCLGDFDGDGEVKIADVQKIAYRWNTSSGDELYDPQYDLDSNGEINIVDVQKVAYRWGTVCGTARQSACADETIAETVALEIRPDSKEVQVGDTFTMGVVISDVVNLGAYEFTLGYDSELLQVTNVALGSFPESTGRDFIEVGPEISPTLGTVSFGAYSQGGTPEGPSGRGQVAVLTLEALKEGSDTLAFDDIQVADIGGTPQDVGASSGSEVSVSGEENDYVYLPIVISR